MSEDRLDYMDEQELADRAKESLPIKEEATPPGPKEGKRLPDDFINPAPGIQGHLCLDPNGIYRPNWVCLRIAKSNENMPQNQYFNMNGKQWLVRIGGWVDVPPEIVTLLLYTDQEVISMDISGQALTVNQCVPKVVDLVPRFSYTALASG